LSGEFEQRKGKFDEEYSKLVRTASVITPKICNKVRGEKKWIRISRIDIKL